MSMMLRLLGLVLPVTAVGAGVAHWATELPPPRSADFPTLLTELAAWTVVGACGWTLALLIAAAVEARTHHRIAATRLVPAPSGARRRALAVLGAAVVCAAPLPAYAGSGDALPSGALAGLPLPARPDGGVTPPGQVHRPRVVVRPGDSLWHLVAARLPSSTPEHSVAVAVAATYRANRRAIGPDPDLIAPGQHLVVRLEPPRHQPTQEDR